MQRNAMLAAIVLFSFLFVATKYNYKALANNDRTQLCLSVRRCIYWYLESNDT